MSDDPTNNNVLERKLSETAASPDDFIALAKGGGGGSGGEGGNIAPPSVVTTAPPSVVVTNAAGNTSKRNRSGPKKFSFYTPTASQNSDLNRIAESGSSSGGSYNKQNSGKQQTTTAQRGVDPPEVEKPTAMAMQMAAMSAEESAWKARSRLIQLQHRESRAQQQQQQHRRSRSANIDEEDDDDDYPMVNIDPIESDDELQLGPYEDGVVAALPKNSKNSGMKQQQQRHQPMYRSPIQGRNNDQSYMKQHPSSAPVRPSHRVPPKQLMQYLHAGRGSFGGGEEEEDGSSLRLGGWPLLPLDGNSRCLEECRAVRFRCIIIMSAAVQIITCSSNNSKCGALLGSSAIRVSNTHKVLCRNNNKEINNNTKTSHGESRRMSRPQIIYIKSITTGSTYSNRPRARRTNARRWKP